MTREEFREWDQSVLDGLKFEWRNGAVEEGGTWMRADERGIVTNLTRRFAETEAYQKGGELIPETDCFLDKIEAVSDP